MVFSLVPGDLYLSTTWHQQVQPQWVPKWSWNSDNDSNSSFHGLCGLIFFWWASAQGFTYCSENVPWSQPEQISAVVKVALSLRNYISSLSINNPAISVLWSSMMEDHCNYINYGDGYFHHGLQWKLCDQRWSIYLSKFEIQAKVWIEVSSAPL